MNPLNEYPQIRKALYIVQWIVNGVITLVGAYYLLSETDPQKWYVVTAGLAPILWTYLGITAAANTDTDPVIEADDLPTDEPHGGADGSTYAEPTDDPIF